MENLIESNNDERIIICNKRKYILYFVLYLISTNLILFNLLLISSPSPFNPYSPEIQNITINDGKSIKIGIISDLQLSDPLFDDPIVKYASENFYQTLSVLKKNNVDLILIAGDISNKGLYTNFELYNKIIYSVYKEKIPKIITIMGNHDYFDTSFSINERQRQFFSVIGDYPYSHFIINNYHFIFWNNDNEYGTDYGITNTDWIKKQLIIAKNNLNKIGDPIFIISHMLPLDTIYREKTREDRSNWGSQIIFDIMKKYSNVIFFCGHSHFSLRNDKSIWQNEFTVINTQSIAYVDLDTDFINYIDARIDSSNNSYMGLIGELNENKINLERIYFLTEEILEDKWEINFPINSSNFNYTVDKLQKNINPPFFDKNNKIVYDKSRRTIKINPAIHKRYIYIYKIKYIDSYSNEKTLKYYGDYYLLPKYRRKVIEFYIPENEIKNGTYRIEIYAFDSFNQISQPLISNIII